MVNATNARIAKAISLYFLISTSNRLLLGAPPKQNYFDRLKQDDCVKNQPVVLDIKKIVLKFLASVLYRRAIRILNLRPARESRCNQMSLLVERNLLGQLRHEVRAFRAWSNETHLALENVPELRNLIHSNLPYDATNTCRAGIAFASPNWSILFGINSHRTKFCERKRPTVLSDS